MVSFEAPSGNLRRLVNKCINLEKNGILVGPVNRVNVYWE